MPRALYRHAEVSYNSGDFKVPYNDFKSLGLRRAIPIQTCYVSTGGMYEGEQPENARYFLRM